MNIILCNFIFRWKWRIYIKTRQWFSSLVDAWLIPKGTCLVKLNDLIRFQSISKIPSYHFFPRQLYQLINIDIYFWNVSLCDLKLMYMYLRTHARMFRNSSEAFSYISWGMDVIFEPILSIAFQQECHQSRLKMC